MPPAEEEDSAPSATREDALPSGIRPFTDYGQFGPGMLDTRVLWQDAVWVDWHGMPHRLEEMSQEYLGNVIDFLYEVAPAWRQQALLHALTALAELATEPEDHADALCEAGDDLARLHELHPTSWIDLTPLMQRLQALHRPAQR
jgi:hypothetical protein